MTTAAGVAAARSLPDAGALAGPRARERRPRRGGFTL